MEVHLQAHSDTESFDAFDNYDFSGDEEFQAGLTSILASNSRTTPEIILKAKIFFYSKYFGRTISNFRSKLLRKFEPIDYDTYLAKKTPARPLTDEEIDRALLSQNLSASLGPQPDAGHTGSKPTGTGPVEQQNAAASSSSDPQMPYPATFAEIVELIKSGKPIPGIRTIPDKTSEGEMSVSEAEPRAKPWEQPGTTKGVSFFNDSNTTASEQIEATV